MASTASGREFQNGLLVVAYVRNDQGVEPPMQRLGAQHVIENDLQRPWFQQTGGAFPEDRQRAEEQKTGVWS